MTGREAAVKALLACEERGAWSDAVLDGIFRREAMSARETALAQRICCGVLQQQAAIDEYIRPCLKGKVQPVVRIILRTAVYQLVYLDRIPRSAAVNTAVELTKKLANSGAAGFVNAVLRNFTANPLPKLPEGKDTESLSLRYSHPKWLTAYFLRKIGAENTRKLLAENNSVPQTCVRVNRLKTDAETVLPKLRAEGREAEALPPLADFLSLSGSLTETESFQKGWITAQDTAAALPVLAAELHPGMKVLDACAAPGGKSFLLAQELRNQGEILACDLHENKLRKIKEGAERLGIGIIRTAAADARKRVAGYENGYDLVLADVPCSGMGVIRKKPEIRYKKPEELRELPKIQRDILENLSGYVKAGGQLIYSTCTLLSEENEAVVQAFLQSHPEFQRAAIRLPEPFGYIESGELTVWPYEYHTDGFYLCRMIKLK